MKAAKTRNLVFVKRCMEMDPEMREQVAKRVRKDEEQSQDNSGAQRIEEDTVNEPMQDEEPDAAVMDPAFYHLPDAVDVFDW